MKINFWTKALSYFIELPLESSHSEKNPHLSLYLSCGQLKLVTEGAIYSYGLKYYHFVESFNQLEIQNNNPKTVLILGLGMGSIPEILEKKFRIHCQYDLVDYDAEVVQLYEKYKPLSGNGQAHIYCEDGMDFIRRNGTMYDLICMDIFQDRRVPKIFETESFLKALKSRLNRQGILIYNRLAMDEEDYALNTHFFKIFSQVFSGAFIQKMAYNWMFVFRDQS